jgi:hypothetical protein
MSNDSKSVKSVAAVMLDAAEQSAAGNAPSMTALNEALANAERNARAKKETVMLKGISAGTWGLLAKDGPIATGKTTPGHIRFFKGLLPRLPAKDAAQVRAILTHYKVVV